MRFDVLAYDHELGDFDYLGAVLLPFGCPDSHLEHALAAVGIYAPRGADRVLWLETPMPIAIIRDRNEHTIVCLQEHVIRYDDVRCPACATPGVSWLDCSCEHEMLKPSEWKT